MPILTGQRGPGADLPARGPAFDSARTTDEVAPIEVVVERQIAVGFEPHTDLGGDHKVVEDPGAPRSVPSVQGFRTAGNFQDGCPGRARAVATRG